MIGLIMKDFIVFRKCFGWVYRIISAVVLAGAVILFPAEGIHYIALLLPMLGVGFLTEIIKAEEKSDWKDYLPALPITSREIVLSRYIFCGILLGGLLVLTFILCVVVGISGGIALNTIAMDYVLGAWFAVLMICFGIPGGYFFKNDLCTGAMIWSCFAIGIIRVIGIDTFLFNLASPVTYAALIIMTVVMVFISYRIALWIYLTKKYAKVKTNVREISQ